jgi:hypothetical protein
MRTSFVHRFMLVGIVLLAVAPRILTGAPQLPSTDAVINKYEQAIGGPAAWMKLTSVRMHGTIEFAGIGDTGSFDYLASAPNRVLATITLPGGQVAQQGCNGLTVWTRNAAGVTLLSGDEWSDGVRDADFYAEIHLRQQYKGINVAGETEVNGHKAYTVIAPVRQNVDKRFFFDEATGLKIASDQITAGQNPAISSDEYSDYRATGGVQIPFMFSSSKQKMIIRVTQVQWNVPIIDATFNPPTLK